MLYSCTYMTTVGVKGLSSVCFVYLFVLLLPFTVDEDYHYK